MTRVHVSLRTADLQATSAFYTRLFGEGPDKVRDGYVRFAPTNVPVLLSLIPGEPGVDHFGIRLPDNAEVEAAWGRVDLQGTEGVVCCHAQKNEAWLADPDGRSWEVYTVTDEAPEAAPSVRSCCP